MVSKVYAKKLKVTKSLKLYTEALNYLPAGVSSNARLMHGICPTYAPCSIFIKKAQGSHIWDVDGNKYIDYRLGYGPVILGHSYEKVRRAIHAAETKGQVYALDNELEIEVAKRIRKMVPCGHMVRYSNSGTEATMAAVRIARAYTKKEKILKFEGHFHGTHDYVLFSTDPPFNSARGQPIAASTGIPKAIEKLVVVEEWNNFEKLEQTVKLHYKDLAAIITEPIMGNAGAIMPKNDYLKHMKELCDKYGILLIFDEVKTGFRVAKGGAQELFKVRPHLATFAKSLGNGYPIAAIAGIKDVMSEIGPMKVAQGGTYSANPVSLTAAKATLDELKKDFVLKGVHNYGKKLMNGIHDILQDHKINHLLQGHPSMFQFMFTQRDVIRDFRDLASCNMDLYAKFQYELLRRGVMIDEDNEEVVFSCYSHDYEDLEHTLEAFEDSVKDVKIPRTSLDIHLKGKL